MREMFFTILAIFLIPTLAISADVDLEWNASTEATGYKIYQSVDNGATWDAGIDVGNVLTHTIVGVPDSGLVIFRASAYNGNGEVLTAWSGAWYNGDWRPPSPSSGLGVQ